MHQQILMWIASFLLAAQATADILVTKDGISLRTLGPWKVQGRVVVFTALDGGLRSLRASEVDFEASNVATAESEAPQRASKDESEREAVLVITNNDIGKKAAPDESTDAAPGEAEREGEEDGASGKSLQPVGVQVVAWEERRGESFDGTEIHGVLTNESRNLITALAVRVLLLDLNGEEVGSSSAFLGLYTLAPGGSTTFRALFPDFNEVYSNVDFEIEGRAEYLTIGAERD